MSKEKKKPKGILKTTEWVWSLGAQLWSAIKDYPFIGWLLGILGTWGMAMLTIFESMPLSTIISYSAIAACAILFCVDRIIRIKQRLAFDPKKHAEFGREVISKSEEMREYLFRKYEIHDLTKTLPIEMQERMEVEGKR